MELRTGKISENVLDRSVAKRLGKSACLKSRPGFQGGGSYLSVDPVTLRTGDAGFLAVTAAANDLLAKGLRPCELQTVVLLPPGTQEQTLRDLEDQIAQAARLYDVRITGGHTEVTGAVTRPVVTASCSGIPLLSDLAADAASEKGKPSPGMDLVVTKWAGLEGTYLLALEKKEELLSVLPYSIVSAGMQMRELLCVQKEAWILLQSGAACICHASGGGILAALWKIGEQAGCGFEAELGAIPIRQETIEITDIFGLNPYAMASAGCLIAAVNDGDAVVQSLLDEGINAACIGRLTESHDRKLSLDGEYQYVNLPAPDELVRVLDQ